MLLSISSRDAALARLLGVTIEKSHCESRLPHQSNPVQNDSTTDGLAALGYPKTCSVNRQCVRVRSVVLDPPFELHTDGLALPSISKNDTCLHPSNALLLVLQRFHLRGLDVTPEISTS